MGGGLGGRSRDQDIERDSTSAATCISRHAIAPSGSLPSKLYHEKLTAISSAAGSILQHEFVQASSQ